MSGKFKWTTEDVKRCAASYSESKSIEKTSVATGIPVATAYRLLKRSGVKIQARGDAHRGRPWTDARRSHHPAKPIRPLGAPAGYDILTQRAIGNKTKSSHGYIQVATGRKSRQYEHTIVAERSIGRKLRRGEVVHHINCDRTDNRPENLLVCTIKYHLQLHARMRKHPYWSQFTNA